MAIQPYIPTCQAVSDKKSTLKALNQRERPRSWLIEANPAYWKKTPMIRANHIIHRPFSIQ